ncbi:hypothetical protein VB780_31000 [Leptolyngbya sp. CCNP1308]|uniref:hypothetical protein n=1 Tax=Leptolyngbya sp. CCNP1308 TaxID=3110255 RepID=UPI002B20D150|nr:hypothetical protein [Leptolyngbya sp. CCNP1308]MEA5453040.1 hypothetical protein [Leptolyngbya sp. CCNP1308]
MGFTLVVPNATEGIRKFSVDFIEALFNAADNMAVHYLSALPDPHIQHAQLAAIAISYFCQLFLVECQGLLSLVPSYGQQDQPGIRCHRSRENSVDRSILDQVAEKSPIKAKFRRLSKNCKGCIDFP